MKICISSCKQYSAKTIPIIVKSLLNSGITTRDMLIVEGGYDERIINICDNITHIKTNHNSFDFTALIDIVEYNIEANAWFSLHDTCRVGLSFKQCLYSADLNYNKIALKQFPSMSIGLFKYSYLQQHRDLILKQINI
jgi:hypothetical protein